MGLIAFLRWTFDLMALRASPADAPASPLLLVQLIVLTLLASFLHLQVDQQGFDALEVFLRLGVNLLLIYAVLWLFGHAARFQQTVIASCAANIVITLVATPLRYALISNQGSADIGIQFLQLGMLGLFVWSFVIDAHIFRHALEIGFWMALALAFSLFMIHATIMAAIQPPV